MARKWITLLLTFVLLVGVGGGWYVYKIKYGGGLEGKKYEKQTLTEVVSVDKLQEAYDVIVVGTDPEGVTAAVSAARNGLRTLLIEGRENRTMLGGLFTEGALNFLDMNWDYTKPKPSLLGDPDYFNKGLFKEWYDQVEGVGFDVITGANAFYNMVKAESNIDLMMHARAIEPLKATDDEVAGIKATLADGTTHEVQSAVVIDATQDADIAYAAGVPFTFGREDVGDPTSKMAVTLVFELKNADEKFWKEVRKRYPTASNERSAWAYNEMQKYPAVNTERAKMRGLNIARQNDDTVLINALQIFGVDPFDPESYQEGVDIAKNELDNVLKHMKELYPEFAKLELGGTANELYVRETRHMQGLYRLKITDLLEHKDQWDRIGFGAYRVDIQRTTPQDNGVEVLAPLKYAIPFRSIVPSNMDGILVVGRSASYDSLAHGSARVVPTGMAAAEAAGVAAKVALDEGITFREMAESEASVKTMQEMLVNQGVELAAYTPPTTPYMEHKAFEGLKAAVYLNMAAMNAEGTFNLDEQSNIQRMVNKMSLLKGRYPEQFQGTPVNGIAGIQDADKQPLTMERAAYVMARTMNLDIVVEEMAQAPDRLLARNMLSQETIDLIADKEKLTDGDMYMMIKDMVEGYLQLRF